MDAARRAVALDSEDGSAHITLSFAFMRSHHFELALSESRKAMELDPTGPPLIAYGTSLKFCGRAGEGIPYIAKGLELSRKDPRFPIFTTRLADAHLQNREYERAAMLAEEIVGRNDGHLDTLLILISSLGHLGRGADAEPAIEHFRGARTNLDEAMKSTWFYLDGGDLEHVRDGLRKAGLSE